MCVTRVRPKVVSNLCLTCVTHVQPKAVSNHSRITREALMGKGFDRHLYALHDLAISQGLEVAALAVMQCVEVCISCEIKCL